MLRDQPAVCKRRNPRRTFGRSEKIRRRQSAVHGHQNLIRNSRLQFKRCQRVNLPRTHEIQRRESSANQHRRPAQRGRERQRSRERTYARPRQIRAVDLHRRTGGNTRPHAGVKHIQHPPRCQGRRDIWGHLPDNLRLRCSQSRGHRKCCYRYLRSRAPGRPRAGITPATPAIGG